MLVLLPGILVLFFWAVVLVCSFFPGQILGMTPWVLGASITLWELFGWLYALYLLRFRYAFPPPRFEEAGFETLSMMRGLNDFAAVENGLSALAYRYVGAYRFREGKVACEVACWFHDEERILAVAVASEGMKQVQYRLIRCFPDGRSISLNAMPFPMPFPELGDDAYQFFDCPPPAELHRLMLRQSRWEGFRIENTADILKLELEQYHMLKSELCAKGWLHAEPEADGCFRLSARGLWQLFCRIVFPFNLPRMWRDCRKTVRLKEQSAA